MNSTQVAVDLAKSVFEVAVSRRPGKVDESHRLSRSRFQRFFAEREPLEVLMEACGTAHHWGRTLEAMGHRVTLLPPGDVSRYRDGNKTDRADAKALLEAARNDAIDAVPVKSLDQQAIAALHRVRSGYQQTRTARINAVRGHLREFGIVIPTGASRVVPMARAALEDEGVPGYLRDVLEEVLDEIEATNRRVLRLIGAARRPTRTITADNGTEFHGYEAIEQASGSKFYFAAPYHSWERGTSENTNGLIRQYLPKRKSMAHITQRHCSRIAHKLNTRPRKRLGYRTPEECYAQN